jgi:hypothetical protein
MFGIETFVITANSVHLFISFPAKNTCVTDNKLLMGLNSTLFQRHNDRSDKITEIQQTSNLLATLSGDWEASMRAFLPSRKQ